MNFKHADGQRMVGDDRAGSAWQGQIGEDFVVWQGDFRKSLVHLLGLPRMIRPDDGFEPVLSDEGFQAAGEFRVFQKSLETEPGVRMPFLVLKPHGTGPFPLALTLHGHENARSYAGLGDDEDQRRRWIDLDQDVAIQAVRKGFVAVVPFIRGVHQTPGSFRLNGGDPGESGMDCRDHNRVVLMRGRTLMGERVWDMMRLLDVLLAQPDIDSRRVLVLGNSGGGLVSLFLAACDSRIRAVVASCCYDNLLSPSGVLRHCTCHLIPGLVRCGELWDVAGLVAPRPLLTVNGRSDLQHPQEEVENAVARLADRYRAAGVPDRYVHLTGEGGHRFFRHLMWPWILAQFEMKEAKALHVDTGQIGDSEENRKSHESFF